MLHDDEIDQQVLQCRCCHHCHCRSYVLYDSLSKVHNDGQDCFAVHVLYFCVALCSGYQGFGLPLNETYVQVEGRVGGGSCSMSAPPRSSVMEKSDREETTKLSDAGSDQYGKGRN